MTNACVLRRRALPTGVIVVLCKVRTERVTPYVTWLLDEATGARFWGHHHGDRANALRDFHDRARRGY